MTSKPRDAAEDRPIEATPALDGESFGTWLRRQRQGRAIDLRVIAETSKISLRYLQALEDDRFDVLPAPVFAKGFLRQYAGFVGLDPEEVVNFFMAARESAERDSGTAPTAPVPRRRRATAWVFVAGAVLLAALLVLVVAWMARLSDASREADPDRAPARSEPTAPRPATPRPATPRPATPRPATPQPTAPQPPVSAPEPAAAERPPEAPARPVTVTLDFIGNCWVEAWLDGVATVAEMRVQGESLQLGADRLVEVKLGDPSMVEAEVNGHRYPVPVTGAVVRLRIDLETVRALDAGGASHPGAGER